MAKPNSTVRQDRFVVALSICRGVDEHDGYTEMRVSEERSLSIAAERARQFVKLHADSGAFPGADVWLNGSLLVFSDGDGEGASTQFWQVAAGEIRRFMPQASGNYRYDESAEVWRLVTANPAIL